ncbi:hypothetical protein F1E84_12550 [Staphylococcus aureus]|nr:hypothetical protein [Staphylococcus aureus]MBD6766110.1 hypothetical protein [Staphylococcus aureus]
MINENRNVTDVYYFSIQVRGPNTGSFEKKFNRQCKLGWGLNKEKLDSQFQQSMQFMYDKSPP